MSARELAVYMLFSCGIRYSTFRCRCGNHRVIFAKGAERATECDVIEEVI